MLDEDHNGEIGQCCAQGVSPLDLNEFFHGLGKIKNEHANDEEIIQHTFNVFDPVGSVDESSSDV